MSRSRLAGGETNGGETNGGETTMFRRYTQDFALKVEKLKSYWAEKKHHLAYNLVSFSFCLNFVVQSIAAAIIGYQICQAPWIAFFSAVTACIGAVASVTAIQGVPRWMQWFYLLVAELLVAVTGFIICTGSAGPDVTMSAYLVFWVMVIVFPISDPGLKNYFQLEDGKKVPLSMIERNILKKEIVFERYEDHKHHGD